MVYHDQPRSMLDYFSKLGYICEPRDNPADFVIDVLINAREKPSELENLKSAYRESSMYQNVAKLASRQIGDSSLQKKSNPMADSPARSPWTEFYYVSQRTLKNTFRDPSLFLAQIIVAVILGFLIGLVFYDLKKTIAPGVQDLLGTIFIIVVTQFFSTLTALEPLIKERSLYVHVSE